MNDTLPKPRKSWQRFVWLMTITTGFIGLILYDAYQKGSMDMASVGILGGVIIMAGKQFFDDHKPVINQQPTGEKI